MNEYERGFNDGFTAALARMSPSRDGAALAPDYDGGKKISVGFRPDQFKFITEYAAAIGCSFGAAVRRLVDQNIKSRIVK